jgi:hypothetical protein
LTFRPIFRARILTVTWAFLDEAADPSLVVEGALVIIGDDEAPVTARVLRLEARPGGTMVVMELVDPGSGTPTPTS